MNIDFISWILYTTYICEIVTLTKSVFECVDPDYHLVPMTSIYFGKSCVKIEKTDNKKIRITISYLNNVENFKVGLKFSTQSYFPILKEDLSFDLGWISGSTGDIILNLYAKNIYSNDKTSTMISISGISKVSFKVADHEDFFKEFELIFFKLKGSNRIEYLLDPFVIAPIIRNFDY